jgi:ubiquitin C-terminal hydrolase
MLVTPERPTKSTPAKELWLCLACGIISCSSSEGGSKPAGKSASKPGATTPPSMLSHVKNHSNHKQHPLFLNLGTLECWCAKCGKGGAFIDYSLASEDIRSEGLRSGEDGVRVSVAGVSVHASADESDPSCQHRGLAECAALVRESQEGPAPRLAGSSKEEEKLSDLPSKASFVGDAESEEEGLGSGFEEVSGERRVVGFTNLGNTCFFNSVLQNLAAVRPLQVFFQGGGNDSQEDPPAEGPLTAVLRGFYVDLSRLSSGGARSTEDPSSPLGKGVKKVGGKKAVGKKVRGRGGAGAYSPSRLFQAVCSKAPRFKGFEQQDAHELLRCLLDGLDTEELVVRKRAEKSKRGGGEGSGKGGVVVLRRGKGGVGKGGAPEKEVAEKRRVVFAEVDANGGEGKLGGKGGEVPALGEHLAGGGVEEASSTGPSVEVPAVENGNNVSGLSRESGLGALTRVSEQESNPSVSGEEVLQAKSDPETVAVEESADKEASNEVSPHVSEDQRRGGNAEAVPGASNGVASGSPKDSASHPLSDPAQMGTFAPDVNPQNPSRTLERPATDPARKPQDDSVETPSLENPPANPALKPQENPAESPKRPPPVPTFVQRTFGGKLSSTVVCCTCGHSSSMEEPFLDLSLPLPTPGGRETGGFAFPRKGKATVVRRRGSEAAQRKRQKESEGEVSAKPGEVKGGIEKSPELSEGRVTGGLEKSPEPVSQEKAEDGMGSPGGNAEAVDKAIGEEGGGEAVNDGSGVKESAGGRLETSSVTSQKGGVGCLEATASVEEGTVPSESAGPREGEDTICAAVGGGSETPVDKVGQEETAELSGETGQRGSGLSVSGGAETVENRRSEDAERLPGDERISVQESAGEGTSGLSKMEEKQAGVDSLVAERDSGRENLDNGSRAESGVGGSLHLERGHWADCDGMPAPELMSVEGCLFSFTREEVLEGENAVTCENCTRLAKEAAARKQGEGKKSGEGTIPDADESTNRGMETEAALGRDGVGKPLEETATGGRERMGTELEGVGSALEGEALGGVESDMDADGANGESVASGRVSSDGDALADEMANLRIGQSSGRSSTAEERPGEKEMEAETEKKTDKAEATSGGSAHTESPEGLTYMLVEGDAGSEAGVVGEMEESDSQRGAGSRAVPGGVVSTGAGLLGEGKVEYGDVGLETDNRAKQRGKLRQNGVTPRAQTALSNGYASLAGEASSDSEGRSEDGNAKPSNPRERESEAQAVRTTSTKRFLVAEAPPILTVHLKRFRQDVKGRLSKIGGHVRFGEWLDLGPYLDRGKQSQR